MTDFRALCAELVEKLDELNCHYNVPSQSAMIERARAALVDEPAVPDGREPASVTGQPSDEEIMGLMPQQMHEDLAYAARAMANEAGTDNRKAKGFMRIALNRHAVDLARAVLARWGNPAPQPLAEGEVEELVTLLAIGTDCSGGARLSSNQCRRAAELLQQKPRLDYDRVQEIATEAQIRSAAQYLIKKQHCDGDLIPAIKYAIARWGNPVPQPVPVSERLPRAEDCDAEGRCWWWRTDDADEWWELLCISDAREYNAGCGNARYTHWRPAHALPLPGQEVAG